MASGTRSSKRKSSPSHSLKKKRRNKDRGKKRSKMDKRKSKKASRPDTNANDESLSDSSTSCSSADFDRRRSRSRIRNDTEQRREKSRRRSSKREKGKDSIQVRESKVLKRGKDAYAKRKLYEKMKRRKPSISSSSGSLSCSTCESSDHSERESVRTKKGVKRSGRQHNRRSRSCSSRSSDDGMGDYERVGKRVKRSTGDLDEDRRSRLHSAGDSYQSQGCVLNENSSRRLRSVIISEKQCEKSNKELIARDDQKGEVACDHVDYHSPRCDGGSIDGETRREVSNQFNAVAGQMGYLEGSKDCYKETDSSIINVSKHPESGDHGAMERNLEVSMLTDVRAKDQRVRTPSTEAVSGAVSLESILRQKALENLKKFKCGGQANPISPVKAEGSTDGKEKEQVVQNAVIELKKNDQKGIAEGLGASSVPHQAKFSVVGTSKALNSTVNTHVSPLCGKPKEEAASLKKEQIATDALRTTRPLEESSFIHSSAAKSMQPRAQDPKISVPSCKGRVIALKEEKSSFAHGTTAGGLRPLARDPKMIPSTGKGRVINLKKGDLGADKFPVQKQPLTVVSLAQNTQTPEIGCPVESMGSQPNDTKVLAAHVADKHEAGALVQCLESDMLKASSIDMSAPAQHGKHGETLQSYPKVIADDDEKSSIGLSNLQGESSDAKETEGEGSQFQKKTMSVTRGGEVVQVSYKVYIPKKTQALARRKLRR